MNIMLVDDEEISNFILTKHIQVHAGHAHISAFTNPVEAYSSLSNINPDIIFLDINMPVMTGWEFLDKMKGDQKQYKVYMLTSSSSDLDKEKAKEYPQVADYLIKPLKTDLLKSILSA